MSHPCWNDLIVDVEKQFPSSYRPDSTLTLEQVERLELIESTSGDFSGSVLYGLSAVGELLVRAAESGQLTDDLAMSTGWLVDSLARLASSLSDQNAAAAYKLHNIKREAV